MKVQSLMGQAIRRTHAILVKLSLSPITSSFGFVLQFRCFRCCLVCRAAPARPPTGVAVYISLIPEPRSTDNRWHARCEILFTEVPVTAVNRTHRWAHAHITSDILQHCGMSCNACAPGVPFEHESHDIEE